MKNIDKNNFVNNSLKTLEELYDLLNRQSEIKLTELPNSSTALIIIDMINGFVREGSLKSKRAEKIIPNITALSKACNELNIEKIAFADSHTDASPEFESYPKHCMAGTSEEEVVEEIKKIGGYILIPKNSTNGFLEERFQTWLKENSKIENFIVTGVCSDICIQQFAITLRTWFNKQNKKSRIIVPINTVDTYDLDIHDGDLMKIVSLYNMLINGVEVVKAVTY